MPLNRLAQRWQAAKRQPVAGRPEPIDLSDSDFHANGYRPPSAVLTQAFGYWLANRCYRPSPKGCLAARLAIAHYYPNQVVSPDNLLLTASTSEAYSLLFGTFGRPGDRVLLPKPGYPLFEALAGYAGLEIAYYPLDHRQDWAPNLTVLDVLAGQKTRFVVIISPNNPTGAILDCQTIAAIGDICQRSGAAIVADEVFAPFLYRPGPLPRPAVELPNLPVYTVNGVSKQLASPDLKLAWIAATGPQAADRMTALELRNDTYLSVNDFSQQALPCLLNDQATGQFVQAMIRDCAINRQSLSRAFPGPADNDAVANLIPAAGGIHCLLLLNRRYFPNDEALALDLLETAGLYLHPGYWYGLDDKPALVISLLKQPPIFRQALDRLTRRLRQLSRTDG